MEFWSRNKRGERKMYKVGQKYSGKFVDINLCYKLRIIKVTKEKVTCIQRQNTIRQQFTLPKRMFRTMVKLLELQRE